MPDNRAVLATSGDTATSQNWSTLLGKAIDDVSRIASAEIRLLGIQISASVEGAVESILPIMIAAAIFIGAEACLLAAVVLLLHKWFEWWISFGATGLGALIVGALIIGVMKTSRTGKLAEIDASLSPPASVG